METPVNAHQTAFHTHGDIANQVGQQVIHGDVNINQFVSSTLYLFMAL